MFENFIDILKEELVPALGCTEPIAIAYAAAKAKEVLGEFPEKITVECSGNIIKNVKGVTVPATNNLKGIDVSAVLGAVGGNASKKLEVLTEVTADDVEKTKELVNSGICRIKHIKNVENLYINVILESQGHESSVTISNGHTNIVKIMKDGIVLLENNDTDVQESKIDKSNLNIKNIYEFAETVDVNLLKDVLDKQIEYNTRIAEEGLKNKYGANVGESLLKYYGDDVKVLAKAYAAAGSDARMSGCTLPVVINSGSGNQGITVSIPIIVYAKHLNVGSEKLYRALTLSNLIAIHQKKGLGKLSAYCGAVSAACGAGAGIAYLHGESFEIITRTITNTIANVSGIVCDGAKPSCAAKIASSVDAAIMGYHMAINGNTFACGEGLVKDDIEDTIDSICKMGKDGMKETDIEIINLMIS
ncbi:MAG: L-serine ammonia-lyase, iron-sulfur-dependent, subunit alpha [Sedimentibacter sp.]|uniref:L-cysteine desulfidase family protein n=1 Tax=Sedimentibacter sp. TaxID=1960295 RepID=UPI00315810F6